MERNIRTTPGMIPIEFVSISLTPSSGDIQFYCNQCKNRMYMDEDALIGFCKACEYEIPYEVLNEATLKSIDLLKSLYAAPTKPWYKFW